MTPELVSHLERHLGVIQEGWKPLEGSDIRAVRFKDQPAPAVDTFATLGLSAAVLPMDDQRSVRQELILPVDARYPAERVASFLTTFADYIRANHRALLRGDVVGPSDPLIPGVRASAVYASIPVLFEPSLATYRGSTPPTVIVWVMPLVENEPQ